LSHDRGCLSDPNADAAPFIDECALGGDPPHDILSCQYERHPRTPHQPPRNAVPFGVANLLKNYGGMPGGQREARRRAYRPASGTDAFVTPRDHGNATVGCPHSPTPPIEPVFRVRAWPLARQTPLPSAQERLSCPVLSELRPTPTKRFPRRRHRDTASGRPP
jgi:hypothetical protein